MFFDFAIKIGFIVSRICVSEDIAHILLFKSLISQGLSYLYATIYGISKIFGEIILKRTFITAKTVYFCMAPYSEEQKDNTHLWICLIIAIHSLLSFGKPLLNTDTIAIQKEFSLCCEV